MLCKRASTELIFSVIWKTKRNVNANRRVVHPHIWGFRYCRAMNTYQEAASDADEGFQATLLMSFIPQM